MSDLLLLEAAPLKIKKTNTNNSLSLMLAFANITPFIELKKPAT